MNFRAGVAVRGLRGNLTDYLPHACGCGALLLQARDALMYWVETMQTGNAPRVVTFLLLVIACSLPGCATKKVYPGPELPRDEVAVISNNFWRWSVTIVAVDGMKGGFWDRYFAVKPGKHTVTVRIQQCTSVYVGKYSVSTCSYSPVSNLSFLAEPNRKYIVYGVDFSNPRYWIEDEGTRQAVGRYPE